MSEMKNLLFLLSLIVFLPLVYCQQPNKTDTGHVEFVQDVRINTLLDKKVQLNERKSSKVNGYRVQIHFGSDREVAKEAKSKFILKYESTPAYERYEQPNFKIRVGDFRSRTEAYCFLKTIVSEFPGSFIVQDEIEVKELIK